MEQGGNGNHRGHPGGLPPSNSGELELGEVYVPPVSYQMSSGMGQLYQMGQELTRMAISAEGVENGVSGLLSGVTRELRRHLTTQAVEDLLRGLADSMAEASKFDVPAAPES